MATGRSVLIALILVALTAVSVAARPPSSKQDSNAYDIKGAPEVLHAEEGKDTAGASPEKDAASNYADAIISDAASKALISKADKYMKEAAIADTPEKAAIAKKAAARSVASALAYAFRGAIAKKAAVAPTIGDATERKEASSISSVGADVHAADEKDAASKYADAIISDAVSKALIAKADKYMKEADVADSPEKVAIAKKAAAQSVASALAYAFRGAIAKKAIVAPTAGVGADAHAADEKEAASRYAKAIFSKSASKAHIKAADKHMKEAAVADSPEKATVAKKAAAQNVAAAMAYAVQGAAAVAPTAADAIAGDKSVKQETSISAPLTKDGAGYKA